MGFLSKLFSPQRKEALKKCTYDSLPEFCLAPGDYDCKVLRVYDGDTFYVALCGGRKQKSRETTTRPSKIKCRLLGVDTPEMPNYANAMEGRLAFAARDRVVELTTDVDLKGGGGRKGLPSFSDQELQKRIDQQNKLVLRKGLHVTGTDKYGRYLVRIKTKKGADLSEILIAEGLAKPYMVET